MTSILPEREPAAAGYPRGFRFGAATVQMTMLLTK